jgi:solute carrier family 13 (sodium-dependent dicarboxylate transporter), member 2/3/5
MAMLWMTEALPLPATALLPVVLFPVSGVLSIAEATAPYANDVIFLFMGGFMLALAVERWGLHRRLALHIVLVVGTRPVRLVGGFMLATAFLSMWISNTATTVMMLPLGASIVVLVTQRAAPSMDDTQSRFAICLMLGIAYAASIGSLGTLVGTPPNLFLRGFLSETYGIEIGFGQWMLLGVPIAMTFLVIAWLLLTQIIYPPEIADIPGGRALIREELAHLGRVSRGEWTVLCVFISTALAWIFREPVGNWALLVDRIPVVTRLTDSGIAIAAALLLFAIPVNARRGEFALDWDNALRLPWGVLILFGGGLSLATAVQTSGLAVWIGNQVGGLDALPTVLLVTLVIATVVFLTELTSNTATSATFLPILGGVALGIGKDPLLLMVPTALAATCAFMMPVATPPNAIVFGSGHVSIAQMVRAGIVLNAIAIVLILGVTYSLASWALGIST